MSDQPHYGRHELVVVTTEIVAAGIAARNARYSSPQFAVCVARALLEEVDKSFKKTLSDLGGARPEPATVARRMRRRRAETAPANLSDLGAGLGRVAWRPRQ